MAEYDPVPREFILEPKQAELYIANRFVGQGEAVPRELATHVLVDDNVATQPELSMFQRAGRGDIENFFRFMKRTLDMGAGRHTQHVLAAICLFPDREAFIDLSAAGAFYLETRGSLAADILANRALLGSISILAMNEYEANIELITAGQLHVPI